MPAEMWNLFKLRSIQQQAHNLKLIMIFHLLTGRLFEQINKKDTGKIKPSLIGTHKRGWFCSCCRNLKKLQIGEHITREHMGFVQCVKVVVILSVLS